MKSGCKNDSPFWHYNSKIDANEIVRGYEHKERVPVDDQIVNYLGVQIAPKYLPHILEGRGGQVEDIPIPANWHSDMAEFAAVLRAVDLAVNNWTMIELGCGWGCWMANSGAAARQRGLKINMVGVEADPDHLEFAKECMETNNFRLTEFKLIHGIAAEKHGFFLFPRQKQGGIDWGLQPVFEMDQNKCRELVESGTYIELPSIGLITLLPELGRVDLLHVDIQGGELDLLQPIIDILCKYVAYIVIGTHSREIEGGLFDLLLRHDWELEIERPAILQLGDSGPIVTVDGVQGWRNRRLPFPVEPREELDYQSVKLDWNDGWSRVEADFRWNNGGSAILRFYLGQNDYFAGKIVLKGSTLGHQNIALSLNGIEVVKGVINLHDQEWVIPIDARNLKLGLSNEIVFTFPDAHEPGNGDLRRLALQIKSISIQ